MASRDNFKSWKMGLPEDSLAWQDLLEYGRELGMQPAETARVILVEWSQARRGRMALGGGVPQQIVAQPQPAVQTQVSQALAKDAEREQAKARGARFAGTLDLDD